MNARAIAIDFDGTLVNCQVKQIACLCDAAMLIGISFDADLVWEAKRNGENNILALTRAGLDTAAIDKIQEFWHAAIETEFYLRYDQFHNDALAVIESLSHNADLFLVSARSYSKLLLRQITLGGD